MWDTKKEIAYHEKMIGVLEMIETLNNRILGSSKYELMDIKNDFFEMKKYHLQRIDTNKKIKLRLINYYKNLRK